VKRLENAPFALLGINSDGPREKVARLLEERGITWRQAIDGTTSGPIASTWGVRAWPTIYVLDEEGVIRSIGARGKMLDEVVEKLVRELEEKK
jgi:hypothetical protein